MNDTDKDKVRELAEALAEVADEEPLQERGLIPAAVNISPAAQLVLKMLWRYLPQLFPFLNE